MESSFPVFDEVHQYDQAFYETQRSGSARSASVVVPLVHSWLKPTSVIDLGCGVGTWLAEFRRHGVEDILGIDGDYVPRGSLAIPPHLFLASDLPELPDLRRRFDLAVSLEVAEHLPDASSHDFISALVALADVVLFSAAIPGQSGTGHVNEQWPQYWVDRFSRHGYTAIDVLRLPLWEEAEVAWWYRQNLLIFATETAASTLRPRLPYHDLADSGSVPALVHPEALARALRLAGPRAGGLPRRIVGAFRQRFRAVRRDT